MRCCRCRGPSDQAGVVTKGAADAILASLYLNAQVYTGTVTAGGLAKGTARWTDAITAADHVINSGQYTLSADWRKNFTPDNHDSKENIFFISNTDAQPDLGMNFPHRTLHYAQLNVQGGPWNGFATIAETYNAFDPADARRNIFLVGPQKSFDTGLPVNDRAGNPLVFTINIAQRDAGDGERGAALQQVLAEAGHPERQLGAEQLPVLPSRRDVPDQGRGDERAGADRTRRSRR